MRFIDANVFVYAVAGSGAISDKARDALARAAAADGAATSVLAIDEVLWALRRQHGKAFALNETRRMLALPGLSVLDNRQAHLGLALDLMDDPGLKPRDALHAAAALATGIKEILTDDTDFDGIPGLKRVPL